MEFEKSKQAYKKIFKILKDNKDLHCFDINDLEYKSQLHLFALQLRDIHGLNIKTNQVTNLDWFKPHEHIAVAWWGPKYNRKISWSDDDSQPKDELLVNISFPTGPYIFGYGEILDKDYPIEFFNRFVKELLSYKPDYTDSHNKSYYWKVENAKEIFNNFPDILAKWHKLNLEDIKKRKIERLEKELKTMKES